MEIFCQIIMYQKLLLSKLELEIPLSCLGKGFTAVSSMSTAHTEGPPLMFHFDFARAPCAQPVGPHKLLSVRCPNSLTIRAQSNQPLEKVFAVIFVL